MRMNTPVSARDKNLEVVMEANYGNSCDNKNIHLRDIAVLAEIYIH